MACGWHVCRVACGGWGWVWGASAAQSSLLMQKGQTAVALFSGFHYYAYTFLPAEHLKHEVLNDRCSTLVSVTVVLKLWLKAAASCRVKCCFCTSRSQPIAEGSQGRLGSVDMLTHWLTPGPLVAYTAQDSLPIASVYQDSTGIPTDRLICVIPQLSLL